jgi:hypothetical protein
MARQSNEHRQPSRDLDYWLRRCEDFRVDGPEGRIGHVRSVRFSRSDEPEVLEVRAGLLGRRTLLIPVAEIDEVIPDQRRLILRGSPRLVGSEEMVD